ncbi:hypothetical protein C900_03747 [Fulvivirga imtechensis AK7]|uniref:DUF5606 domain-containing protein n=1 Tax=Fulvivirga imtechensis AK7 TaxID=1237149 RepID=L8JQB5_9BACT|nr:DUF5606 domain-containing protein [Fulvivirga imtechensis]ELR70393.1 hypothetical protein C900_03747 [Fulvivirga imtechensis AK7]
MDYSDIASVAGKGGLFKIVKPTRTGVILESLDDKKQKLVASATQRISVLSDISIYTTNQEGSTPLEDVFRKINKEFDDDLGVTATSEPDELKAFLKHILPDYDEQRVYVSDIKKVVNWYNALRENAPELLKEKKEDKKKEKKEPKEQKSKKTEKSE